MVKCWDLEVNKVIRHYHGHFSGVYSLSYVEFRCSELILRVHPTLDVLCTGGRDASVRVSIGNAWTGCVFFIDV